MPKKPKKISGVGSHAQKERNQKGNRKEALVCRQNLITLEGVVVKDREPEERKKAVVEKAKEGNPGGRKVSVLDIPEMEGA